MKSSKILLSIILPFLGFLTNVKADIWDYDFSSYNKASQIQFGLYNDTTLQGSLVTCTSSNDGYCVFENDTLPSGDIVFNNLRFVLRGTDGVSFTAGSQYKMSFFFASTTSDYYITQSTLSNTTGVSYQNFTNWTSNDLSIITSNIVPVESHTYSGVTSALYRVDIVFVVSSSSVAGFNIRLYRQPKTTYASTPVYLELFRYLSINQMTAGQIDYSQDLDNINTNITNMGDDITNNQNQNTQDIIDNQNQNAQDIQDTINDNFQSCRDSKNLFNYSSTYYVENQTVTITGTGEDFTISSTGYGLRAFFISQINFSTIYAYMSSSYVRGSITLYSTNSNSYGSWHDFYHDRTLIVSNWNITQQSSFDLTSYQGKYLWITLRGSYTDENYTSVNYKDFILSKEQVSAYEAYGQQVCVNKLDEQNNSINNINDSINNSDVSGAESDASNFFNNFTESDHGGISAIVTAPLVVVRSMLSNNSCTDLQFEVMNTPVSFPSGCILWNHANANVVSIWQMIVCGYISYLLLRKLFKDIENLKNPNNEEVSTVDL